MHTALTLAIAVFAGGAAYLAWAVHAVASGANILWFVLGAPVAALAIPAMLIAVWFTLAWVYRAPRPPAVRIGVARLPGLYIQELRAVAGSIPRMIFYRALLPDPVAAPAAAPVLLLHGVLCNAGVWQPMRRFLAARGIGPIYALSYGPPLGSIELFAQQLANRIDGILRATGARKVILVTHSMGGLVARAYLHRHGGGKVERLVTLGAPHHGSMLAHMFPGIALRQMRPGNAWLAELNAVRIREAPPIVSLWSWHDSMVAPQTSSVLDGAENVALVGIAHNALLRDPAVHARVAGEIERHRPA
jgi:triacylglycerol esterase/lipase EstA (alpha/beta hydrolase family)